MIRREGSKVVVQGPVTIDNVMSMTQQGIALFIGGQLVIDFAKMTEVDSTVVSMLLEWLREAQKSNCRLQFACIPENLESLIQLYGITELIPLSTENQ